MERKHFLTLGAGLTVGSLMGKSPLSISAAEKLKSQDQWLQQWLNDAQHPVPVDPSQQQPEADSAYWDFIRGLFPLNPKITFLNNGTMGITPLPVLEALNKSFRNLAENAAYPMHDGSFEEQLGQIMGCKGSELAITKNVSEGVNLACRAIALKNGDEVIITRHEHVGGCAPWLYRAKTEGIVLKVVKLGSNAAETLANVKKAKTPKTKVVALPHIPCTIGQILPIKEICAWAKENHIISAIDGAHPLGMIEFNLKELGCDYYSGCFHKWLLGPIGTGFFYVSENILATSAIHHVAAYSVDTFNMSTIPPSLGDLVNKTSRYSYGTFPGPMYDGAKAAMQFYQKIGPALIEKRVKHLSQLVMNGLMDRNSQSPIITILTPQEDISRGAQVGFTIKGLKQTEANPTAGQRFCDYARKNNVILRYVAENDIHCVRVSTHYYNNLGDIKKFFEVLDGFLKEEGWF